MPLTLVPTPVGNLDDMTLRGLAVLREADFVLCEDTRTSSVLMRHFDLRAPLVAFHKFNEHQVTPAIVERLKNGQKGALITDAGTPGISDPGFLIVRECVAQGVAVTCLPGATAFVPALVASGLPADRFVFEGFLPVKKGRQSRLRELAKETRTLIIYESPLRTPRTLRELSEVFGPERQAVVARELSKLHEEFCRGSLTLLARRYEDAPPKGEIVLLVAGADPSDNESQPTDTPIEELRRSKHHK